MPSSQVMRHHRPFVGSPSRGVCLFREQPLALCKLSQQLVTSMQENVALCSDQLIHNRGDVERSTAVSQRQRTAGSLRGMRLCRTSITSTHETVGRRLMIGANVANAGSSICIIGCSHALRVIYLFFYGDDSHKPKPFSLKKTTK